MKGGRDSGGIMTKIDWTISLSSCPPTSTRRFSFLDDQNFNRNIKKNKLNIKIKDKKVTEIDVCPLTKKFQHLKTVQQRVDVIFLVTRYFSQKTKFVAKKIFKSSLERNCVAFFRSKILHHLLQQNIVLLFKEVSN